jgi:hypothetical protein
VAADTAQPYLQDLPGRSRGEVAWFGAFIDGDFRQVATVFGSEREQARLGCNCAAAVVTDAVGTPVWVIGVTSFSSRSDTRTLRGPAASSTLLG